MTEATSEQASTTPAESGQVEQALASAAESTQQTSQSAPAAEENAFFDYNEIKGNPALEAAYKQMQSSYTRKMQSFTDQADKIQAYDSFMQNPMQEIQRLAQQYGYQLTQAQQQAQQQQQESEWNPQSWDEVVNHAKLQAKQEILQEFQPIIGQVQEMKKQNTETYLDNNYPDWKHYEDAMIQNLNKHPSLANDPDTLYRMSVPESVMTQRATKAALDKLKSQTSNAQVSSGNQTNSQPPKVTKVSSFEDAVEKARQDLAQRN